MPSLLLGGGRSTACVLGNFAVPYGGVTSSVFPDETVIPRTAQVAGTFSNFGVSVNASGTARSVQFRKNSANGNEVVSFTDSTQQAIYDSTNTDHVAVNDTFDIKFIGTAPAFTPWFVKAAFAADSGHVGYYGSGGSAAATTSNFFSAFGGTNNTTEANSQNLMRAAGTLSNLLAVVTAASTSTATVVSRIDGVTGNASISITANLTGTFSDNTHTDAFTAGKKIGVQCSGQSTALTFFFSGIITWGATTSDVVSGMAGGSISFNASNQFLPIVGTQGSPQTTEAVYKLQHGFAGVASNMRLFLSTNTFATPVTFVLRKNGANGNQTISIGGTAQSNPTGWFEDTTNTDTFQPTDDICYMISGGTSGSAQTWQIMLTETGVSVTTDASVGAEALSSQRRDSVPLVEALSALTCDISAPTNVLASATRDMAALLEVLALQRSDAAEQAELISAVLQIDRAVPFEFISSVRKEDSLIPVELLAGMRQDHSLPTEFAFTALSDVGMPLEALSSARGDAAAMLAFSGAIVADAVSPMEIASRVTSDATLPIENIGGTTGVVGNASIQIEFKGMVRSDGGAQAEAINDITVFIAPINAEVIALVRFDQTLVDEVMLAAQADSAINVEIMSTARNDSPVAAEFVSLQMADLAARAEFISVLTADTVYLDEVMFTASRDSGMRIEMLPTQAADARMQLESVALVRADVLAQTEAGENVEGLSMGSPVQLEFTSSVRGDVVGQVEYTASRVSDVTAVLEVLLGVARDSNLQAEYAGTIVITGNAAVAMEFLGSVRADTPSPTNILASVRSDLPVPPEELASARGDASAIVEMLSGVVVHGGNPLEVLLAAARDASAPLDFESTVSEMGAGVAVQFEFLSSVQADRPVTVGWGFLAIPARIISNVRQRVRVVYNSMYRAKDSS